MFNQQKNILVKEMIDKNPLISIAMATYNGEKFLKKQLDSIYTQTYTNIEVVVTDDCSTDRTVDILKEYQENHGLKYYVNDQNLGFVKNFEKAISLCRGEYITLSDQDDIWLPIKIKELITHIGNNLLIHSDAYLIDESSNIFSNSYEKYSRKMVNPTSLIDTVINGYITGCTCMFSKRLLKDILPFPQNLYVHDKWIGCNAFYHNKIVYYDKPLIKYRQHAGNFIGVQDMENISYLEKIKKYLKQRRDKSKNVKYYTLINNQLEFAQIVYNKFYKNLTVFNKLKLNLLRIYYSSILNNSIAIKAFFIRLLMFKHFEINKPIKVRIFGLFRILIKYKREVKND